MIFLSENKELDDASYIAKARQTLLDLSAEQNSNDYINYKQYLDWINKSDGAKLKVLKEGKSARNAMLKMISPELDQLSSEEDKSLVEDGEQQTVMAIRVGNTVFNFSSSELNNRLVDLPLEKADGIKKALHDSEIVIAKKLRVNTPRFSEGAGKCGDIENAIVEGVAKFLPINNGEMFLYFSSIGNIYMVTDKIVEGESGGIMFPNVIYSIPRPLLIKLSVAAKLPESITGITEVSIKPVREIATSTGNMHTLNQVYSKEEVIGAFESTLSQIRNNLF